MIYLKCIKAISLLHPSRFLFSSRNIILEQVSIQIRGHSKSIYRITDITSLNIKTVQDFQAFKRTVSLLQLFLHKIKSKFAKISSKLRHSQKIGINFIAQLLTRMHYTISSRLFLSCSIRVFMLLLFHKMCSQNLIYNLQGKCFVKLQKYVLKYLNHLCHI